YIGGLGLSRGYLGRPDLTAERFLPHPFDSGGARLYKTGDLVRLLPDSSLEFLGRIDHQVKIRGFRIELGEVEVALRQHHAVREAIVLIDDAGSHEKRLLAFIVPHLRAEPSPTELRLFLRERLPEYMLPALFLILDALPLTPSAKIDQHALLAFARTHTASDEAFAAPRTTTEQILAEIWSDVLSLERVGIDANFFALGGHSLAVTRVMARVRAIFGAELPLESLFSSPTIREFALLLPQDHPQTAPARDFPIQPAPYAQDLPLSFAQERVWMIQQLAPETIAYTAPAILHIEGELHIEVLERCFTELIARHAVLRTTFPLMAGRPVQRIHALAKADLRFIDLQALAPQERQAAAQRLQREELCRPFDITRLPLMRLTLLRINPQEYHLLLVEHHMVHDGWSTNLLLAELLQLYPAFLRGEPVSLPPLPIQFADFAYW